VLPHTLNASIGRKPAGPRLGDDLSASPDTVPQTLRIAVALFDGAEELDWAGPWEVFGYWASRWPDEVEVFTIAETLDPIRCARGLRVLPDRTWGTAPIIDVLIYPGGRGARTEMQDECVLERLNALSQGGTLLASVCTGALVLAAAGVLQGKAATTHVDAIDDLATFGGIRPRRARFVDAGDVVTSAGVSAGIDMSLHLAARLHSPRKAEAIRRAIEYEAVLA
jgi:transcriptional regulator GlxA family with amidase domain